MFTTYNIYINYINLNCHFVYNLVMVKLNKYTIESWPKSVYDVTMLQTFIRSYFYPGHTLKISWKKSWNTVFVILIHTKY